MRGLGLVMLIVGLAGLGGGLYLSQSATVSRLRTSCRRLLDEQQAARLHASDFADLRSRKEELVRTYQTAADSRFPAEARQAKVALEGHDERIAAAERRLEDSEARLIAARRESGSDLQRLRIAESFITAGYVVSGLIPAGFAFILGSFRRVGRSLRPQNRLARHPFLAVLAVSLVLGGVIVAVLGILTLSAGQFSELPATRFFTILFLFIATPLAATIAGGVMLVALFRPWDRDDVG